MDEFVLRRELQLQQDKTRLQQAAKAIREATRPNIELPNSSNSEESQNSSSVQSKPAVSDPDKLKLIQQTLLLFLHAINCMRRENQANGEQFLCTLPYCRTVKDILSHMQTCAAGKTCQVQHCSSSRQIIGHWKHCTRDVCLVCMPQREAMKNLSFGRQFQSNAINLPTVTTKPIAGSSNQQAQSAITTKQVVNQFRQNLSMQIVQSQNPKEWHKSVPEELRIYLVHKVVQAIFPTPDASAMLDQRMHTLLAYARKVESDMYKMANSRSEYYHLLAGKIYEIQKELEEKRVRRAQLRQQQEQQTGLGASQLNPSQMSVSLEDLSSSSGANGEIPKSIMEIIHARLAQTEKVEAQKHLPFSTNSSVSFSPSFLGVPSNNTPFLQQSIVQPPSWSSSLNTPSQQSIQQPQLSTIKMEVADPNEESRSGSVMAGSNYVQNANNESLIRTQIKQEPGLQ